MALHPRRRLAPLFSTELGGTGVLTTVVEAPEVEVEIVGRDDERLGRAGGPVTAPPCGVELVHRGDRRDDPGRGRGQRRHIRAIEGLSDEPTAPHLLVHAERHSESVVVIDHVGSATLTETVEIVVDDGAHLTLVSVQDWGAGAVHAPRTVPASAATPSSSTSSSRSAATSCG